MSKGPKNVTSTTSTEPPSFLVGPLTTAVNAAQSQFTGQTGFRPTQPATQVPQARGRGGDLINRIRQDRGFGSVMPPTGIPGTTPVVPGGSAAAGQPVDLIGQGQGLIGNTLAGNFLTPETNPFLEQTFNRAADLTRTRLSSEFAGAGRDLSAAMPARSEELQTLASNIFGGNFQAERDRQNAALSQGLQFDPLNLFINRLAGIIPGAGGTTQSTQPVYRTGIFGF